MKKILCLLLLAALCVTGVGCSKQNLTGLHRVQIDVQDYGTILVELDADTAPITVTNFVNLVKNGFYNGLTFHRIMAGFMVQGGAPNGNSSGGSKETIMGEFSTNNIANNILHERGVISMARQNGNNNSASSQFFIMHATDPSLDSKYAAFGHVLEGMDVVDAICAAARPYDNNGSIFPEEQPVITAITVVSAQ